MKQDLEKEYFTVLGKLMPGIAHELNNPVGFVGSNLETVSGYLNEIVNFISQYENELESKPELEHFKNLRKQLDIDFVLDDCRNALSESLGGTNRLKKLIETVQSQFGSSREKVDNFIVEKLVSQVLQIAHNELKYTATVSLTVENSIIVKCFCQELSYIILIMLLDVFEFIGQKGEILVKISEVDSNCLISISGKATTDNEISKTLDAHPNKSSVALEIANKNGWNLVKNMNESKYELYLSKQ